jgi:cyclic pyranopterin phosphate synthase
MQPLLIDGYGRHMRKLRVSLLAACNFRCFYCMPAAMRFAANPKQLSPTELHTICQALVSGGISQIRITGGEPTLRKDFREVISALASLPLEKLGMTSNGFLLEPHLPLLKALGCDYLNISLDSLQAENFNRMTRSMGFEKVMGSILKAHEMGFQLKLNTVIMRGENDHELLDFVRFSEAKGIEVRFLELMKIGMARQFQPEAFISAEEQISRIQNTFSLSPLQVEKDATAFSFKTQGGGKIGFIASESRPFCGDCSRLRLSHDGKLRACLMLNQGKSLRNLSETELLKVTRQVMALKPFQRRESVAQNMYRIGG